MYSRSPLILLMACAVVAAFGAVQQALAYDTVFDNGAGTGNYNTAANWDDASATDHIPAVAGKALAIIGVTDPPEADEHGLLHGIVTLSSGTLNAHGLALGRQARDNNGVILGDPADE